MSVEQPPSSTFLPPVIDKYPPRPAQTEAYSWKEYNSRATNLYIRDHGQANEELSKLDVTVLGFDIEWKPKHHKGGNENRVALVQLANYNSILLLQISAMKEFPSKLAEILANSNIVKTGVAIQSDALKIYNDHRVSIYNCVDLSLFARTVDNAHWQGKYTRPLGLARLIERYEQRILVKGRTSCSNWEALLSKKQQEYASNDAHAGFTLYRKLEILLPLLPTPPKRAWYSFDAINGRLYRQDGTQWHADNPNYDPGPLPPPGRPGEVKASMIITADSKADSNGEPPSKKACKNKSRSQERNYLSLSTSQQSSTGRASGSTQQLQPRGHGTHELNSHPLPKNSGHTLSQHRPTGALYRYRPGPGLSRLRMSLLLASSCLVVLGGSGWHTFSAVDDMSSIFIKLHPVKMREGSAAVGYSLIDDDLRNMLKKAKS